jgi:hypothetical protein
MAVEVDARRHLHAIGAVPEVDGVQVGGEDPVLGPPPLQLPGECGLLELAADRPFLLGVRVLDELLRDRRAALDEPFVADVGPGRAQDPFEVDTAVLPEAPVLDRHNGLLHHRGDLVRAHDDTAFVPVEDGEHCLAIGGVDVAELFDVVLLRRLERGQVARHGAHEAEGERHEADYEEKKEEGQEPELADPAPLGRLAALAKKHEAPESSWVE